MPIAAQLVRLYHLSPAETFPQGLQPLRIGQKSITMFRDVLMDQMQLLCNQRGWWLEFFSDTEHVQRFLVTFSAHNDSQRDQGRGSPLTKMGYTQLMPLEGRDFQQIEAELEAACWETSQMVRGAGGIRGVRWNDLYEASSHFGWVDGRGTLFINKRAGMEQFERHVLLHALAYAYLLTMEKIGNNLSRLLLGPGGVEQEEALRQLYKRVALFNARSFFHQPALLSHGPNCEAWRRIDQALGVRDANAELLKQIQNAHSIGSWEEEKQLQQQSQQWERKEKLRDICLALIAFLVAIASVPGVLDLATHGW